MPLFSVVVPTFNRADVLLRALDSVAKQGWQAWELIVVDDGSTDDTANVMDNWLRENHTLGSQVKYLKTENRGVSAARNLGVQNSAGQWLCFLDSDDEWLPNKLAEQVKLTSDFKWIHGEEIWIRHGVRVNAMKKHAKSGGDIFERCVELCCVSPSTVAIERSLFESSGGFREDYPVCEDYELWLRLSVENRIGFVSEPIIKKYGGHEDQLSGRYKAMDYYRVKALMPFLENKDLSPEQKQTVFASIQHRCSVLLKGYEKHQNFSNWDEVIRWQKSL